MYDPDLGLRHAPFHDAVDPDLFYPCPSHRTAARQLLAAALRTPGGVIALTGEPGTGKTTILKRVVRDVENSGGRVLWGHALQSFDEMVAALGRFLGWAVSQVEPAHSEAFRATLVAEARRHGPLVLAIDEAQHLEPTTLAGLSDLVNEAAAVGARFSMILVGYSSLAGKLAATAASGDRPRAFTEVGLPSLPPTEVGPYVEHRLWYAGAGSHTSFPRTRSPWWSPGPRAFRDSSISSATPPSGLPAGRTGRRCQPRWSPTPSGNSSPITSAEASTGNRRQGQRAADPGRGPAGQIGIGL